MAAVDSARTVQGNGEVRPHLAAQGAARDGQHPRAQRARGAHILAFTERAAAIEVEKVLRSAVANAESNPDLHWNGDDLVVQPSSSTRARP